MTLYGLWIFSLVYFLAVATPGPGVAAIIARSLAQGTRGSVAFIAGFLVGDLIWFIVAATGLAALAQTAQTAFLLVKYGCGLPALSRLPNVANEAAARQRQRRSTECRE